MSHFIDALFVVSCTTCVALNPNTLTVLLHWVDVATLSNLKPLVMPA